MIEFLRSLRDNWGTSGASHPAARLPYVVRRELAMGKRFCLMLSGFAAGVIATVYFGHALAVRAQLPELPGNSAAHPRRLPREMVGLQMRLQALALADANRDGWISFAEMKGKRCVIANLPPGTPGRVEIDYGSFDDEDGDGYPDLNPIFYPIFVDKDGKRIATARNLKFPGVAGYTFEVQCFGFGHLYMPFRP